MSEKQKPTPPPPLAAPPGSGTAHLRSRDLCMPRIRPGVRVRFDNGKWDCCVNAVRHDQSWATKPWAMTQVGVTVDPDEFPGSIFPNNGPWGLPDFATPVRWDGFETVTWVRTSCLDVIEDENVIRSGQQVLMFESPNAPGEPRWPIIMAERGERPAPTPDDTGLPRGQDDDHGRARCGDGGVS